MAKVDMDNDQRKRLIDIIAQYGDVGTPPKRQIFLENTGLSDAAPERISNINIDGNARDFAQELVRKCQEWGTLTQTQQPALLLVIQYLRDEVVSGQESEARFLDGLMGAAAPVITDTRPLKIFVSYRRKSWAFTQRLAEDMRQRLNADVFMDLQSIDESDFEKSILHHLRESDVVVLVVTEYTFDQRIHNEGDWVRREIAESLRLKKPIITVAVDGVYTPSADQLPDDIKGIGRMQGVPFYAEPEFWDGAMQRLVGFISKVTRIPVMGTALEVRPSDANTLRERYNHAMDLLEVEEWESWDRAILMLEELRTAGFRQRYVDIDAVIAEATTQRNRAIRRIEMMEAYQDIARLSRSRMMVRQARHAWMAFKDEYGDEFNPADDTARIEEKFKTIGSSRAPRQPQSKVEVPSEYLAIPTAEQKRLLDIMRDSTIPPPQRAEAGRELAKIGDPRKAVTSVDGMQFCFIPKGRFWMGSDDSDSLAFGDEKPAAWYDIPYHYWMARFPVTNAQFQAFVADNGYTEERWWSVAKGAGYWSGEGFKGQFDNTPRLAPVPFDATLPLPNHPVVGVSWYESIAFTEWLTARWREKGYLSAQARVMLPGEPEWEKAARGGEQVLPQSAMVYAYERLAVPSLALVANPYPKRRYPYGNDADATKSNYDTTGIGTTNAVGIFAAGASPYGCEEMSGNVWEWSRSGWKGQYPYEVSSEDATLHNKSRVVRGGAFNFDERYVRCAYRFRYDPDIRYHSVGLRVAVVGVSP